MQNKPKFKVGDEAFFVKRSKNTIHVSTGIIYVVYDGGYGVKMGSNHISKGFEESSTKEEAKQKMEEFLNAK